MSIKERLRRNIPLYIAAFAGNVIATHNWVFTLFGWLILMVAVYYQDKEIERHG